MDVGTADKSVLGNYLSSLTAQISELRNTAAQILMWSAGASIIIVGWQISKGPGSADIWKKVTWSLSIIALNCVSYKINKEIEKYFNEIASVIKSIDNIYQMHEPGVYITEQAVLPDRWKKFGTPEWEEAVFTKGYWFRFLITSVCCLCILLLR